MAKLIKSYHIADIHFQIASQIPTCRYYTKEISLNSSKKPTIFLCEKTITEVVNSTIKQYDKDLVQYTVVTKEGYPA